MCSVRCQVLIISTLCLAIGYSNVLLLHLSVTCEPQLLRYSNLTSSNLSEALASGARVLAPVWSRLQFALAFAAPWLSAVATAAPLGWASQRVGLRRVVCVCAVVSALATALCPLALNYSFLLLILCRLLQGALLGAFPALIPPVVANWAPLLSTYTFSALLMLFLQLAPLFAMPTTAAFCPDSLSFSNYLHAALTVILYSLFGLFFRENARKHPQMSGAELNRILKGRISFNKRQPPAHKAHTRAVVWLTTFLSLFVSQAVILYGPSYLRFAGGRTEDVGWLAALPALTQLCAALCSWMAVLTCRRVQARTMMRAASTVLTIPAVIFLLVAVFVPLQFDRTFVMLTGTATCIGFGTASFVRLAALSVRQDPWVMAGVPLAAWVANAALPFTVALLVPHWQSTEDWRPLWAVCAVALVAAHLLFYFFGQPPPDDFVMSDENCIRDHDDNDNVSMEAGILEMRVITDEQMKR